MLGERCLTRARLGVATTTPLVYVWPWVRCASSLYVVDCAQRLSKSRIPLYFVSWPCCCCVIGDVGNEGGYWLKLASPFITRGVITTSYLTSHLVTDFGEVWGILHVFSLTQITEQSSRGDANFSRPRSTPHISIYNYVYVTMNANIACICCPTY